VNICGYCGDNGVYKARGFTDDLLKQSRTMKYCGVGAHHHNSIAEWTIRSLSTSARTMLLHSMIHWPTETTLDLWPFAMEYAVYLWNCLPCSPSGLSPQELFYSVKSNHNELRAAKVWGCPTYVLDPRLQDSKNSYVGSLVPSWVNLWAALENMPQMLDSLRTLKPAKLVVNFTLSLTKKFTTLPINNTIDTDTIPSEWMNLFIYNRENTTDPSDLLDSEPTPVPRFTISTPSEGATPTFEPSDAPSGPSLESEEDNITPPPITQPTILSSATPLPIPSLVPSPIVSTIPNTLPQAIPIISSPFVPRRSTHVSKPPTRLDPSGHLSHIDNDYLQYLLDFRVLHEHNAILITTNLTAKSSPLTVSYDVLHMLKLDNSDPDIIHGQHPFAFSAWANANDDPKWNEVMTGPDREGFLEAMKLEIEQLESLDSWNVVPSEKALQENRSIIDSTWAFKRKRYPDGSVKKLKARFVVCGYEQVEGVDYFDTFSPVVQWSTIRLMFVLSIMLGLKTCQVDYTLAFVQAKASPRTYIEMPKLFDIPGKVLELKRNLYGMCEAPRNFYHHLKKGLEDCGFTPSPHNHCLFMSANLIAINYVDDCIFFARDNKTIDSFIASLQKAPKEKSKEWDKFLLNKEEDYAGFLGIDISESKFNKGKIELLQIGLIDRILQVLSLDKDNAHVRLEPASPTPLGKDEEGDPRKEDWSYPSVIGMLLYLASNSQPNIAFAVNQAARFTHCPRLSHEIAVRQIARYLKANK
jgi:hypothetical protein